MNKYFKLLVCVLVSLFAFNLSVNAATKSTNLVEAVNEEIEYFGNKDNFEKEETFQAYQEYVSAMKAADLSSYSESDDKVNVYIFRGYSCWHCLDEITWLASNYSELSDLINVHTYEVWENKNNSKLMNLVAKQLGKQVSGVPFTVIGNTTYSGFSEETGAAIVAKAKELKASTERYDIKNVINLDEVTLIGEESAKGSSKVVVYILIATVVIGGAVLIYLISKSK